MTPEAQIIDRLLTSSRANKTSSIVEAIMLIESLTAERDAALLDARRYRWWRTHTANLTLRDGKHYRILRWAVDLPDYDATIDEFLLAKDSHD